MSKSPNRSPRVSLHLEPLEDRVVPASTIQITDSDISGSSFLGSISPAINGDGTRIAFSSDADFTGQNADGSSEIFLFDTAANQFTQITNEADGGEGSFNPDINGDGTRIVFESDGDFTGQNGDGSPEIFLFDTTTDQFTQITDDADGGEGAVSLSPAINGDGTRIVFESNANFTGDNPDGSFEIFLFDTNTNQFTQITDDLSGGGDSFDPTINLDGTRIAFESNSDLTGQNTDGSFEIFLFDTNSNTLTQITDDEGSGGSSSDPSINGDGTRIAFESFVDLTGQNSDGSQEIFLFDTNTNTLTQITDDAAGGEGNSSDPSINSWGTRIAFESNSDLTGQNADGFDEIFLFDTVAGQLTQITNSDTNQSFDPSINVDGTRIAFVSGDQFQSRSEVNPQGISGLPDIFLHDTLDRDVPLVISGTNVDPASLNIQPFPGFNGEVRVATGDVTGDGIPDILAVVGPGGGPHVRVFDGETGNLIRDFFAFHPAFLGGVFVSASDVNRDGFADIVVGADAGGGPHVKVFDGQTLAVIREFFAYAPSFLGGVRVTSADINGDGFAEIITGAGAGGGPHVKIFDGRTGAETGSFFAFDPAFTGGIYVAANDLNRDGLADIVVGAGAGGGPQVRGFSGLNPNVELLNFFAYDPAFTGGVRVGVKDFNADVVPEIITGAGPGAAPHVRIFNVDPFVELESFFAFDAVFTNGVFVDGV